MRVHPAAAVFPMLDDDALDELARDIKEHGQREPVVLNATGVLLDGRNRLAACERAGVSPATRTVDLDEKAEVDFIVSANMHRRHLTASQKAMVALELVPFFEAIAKEKQHQGRPPGGQELETDRAQVRSRAPQAREQAAAAAGSSSTMVGRARRVAREAPELAEKVRAGEMPLSRADAMVRDGVPLAAAGSTGSRLHRIDASKTLHRAVPQLAGVANGLSGLDVEKVAPDEAATFAKELQKVVTVLAAVRRELKQRGERT